VKHNDIASPPFASHLIHEDLDPAFTQNTMPFVVKENTKGYDDPIIHFVNNIIHDALQKSASDIHIEPYDNICRIRHRQDGVLYEITTVPFNLSGRLITRLKVMANLDISERRLPQDGRFQLTQKQNHTIDVRMNTCPTLFGEKVVLRLLDEKKVSLNINSLGMTTAQEAIFLDKITKPQGMILVTGPTGSGKTVTLYAALRHLNTTEKNISTIEDPIEIQLNGINQISAHPKIGLDFSTMLRALLRQDPDILMVGEIRDRETAQIALQAAQTGHLVLSTVHTNSAADTLIRLQAMGVAPYDLVSSISLIIAQRLVRKLCPLCKRRVTVPAESLKLNDTTNTTLTIYEANGCEHCLKGYCGRLGIYEFLLMTEQTAQQILAQQPVSQLVEFNSLRKVAMTKLKDGETTLAEINRVIHD
jgi:type IV pilus assembly protein PilB